MRPYKSYSGDPRWITAKFNSTDSKGNVVRKGDRVFYYPRTKAILTGQEAESAAAQFASAAADEALETGQYY
jgi:hypothetical protein